MPHNDGNTNKKSRTRSRHSGRKGRGNDKRIAEKKKKRGKNRARKIRNDDDE